MIDTLLEPATRTSLLRDRDGELWLVRKRAECPNVRGATGIRQDYLTSLSQQST
jgi:hypothetical protein